MSQDKIANFLSKAYLYELSLNPPKKGWRSSLEIIEGTKIKKATFQTYMNRLTRKSSGVGIFLQDGSRWRMEKKKPHLHRKRHTMSRWDIIKEGDCAYYLVYRLIPLLENKWMMRKN